MWTERWMDNGKSHDNQLGDLLQALRVGPALSERLLWQ